MANLIYVSDSVLFNKSANSIHVTKMSDALTSQGLNVHLYCYGEEKTELDEFNAHSYYGISNEVEIKYYSKKIPYSRLSRLYTNLISAIKLHLIYKSTMTVYYGRNLFVLFILKLLGNKVNYEIHALDYKGNRFLFCLKCIMLKKMDKIISITNALMSDVIKACDFKRLEYLVLPDGADIVTYSAKGITANTRLKIAYVGSFYQGRGVDFILKIAKLMPEYDFLIIGARDLAEKNEYLKKATSNVNILEYIPHSKLGGYYVSFDIVLAPYESSIAVHGGKGDISRWASPLKLFEYMAYGKCILVSDISVFKEVLKHDHNCLFCKPVDIKDWSNKIRTVGINNRLREKLGHNAYNDFKEKYSWDSRAKKMIEFLGIIITK